MPTSIPALRDFVSSRFRGRQRIRSKYDRHLDCYLFVLKMVPITFLKGIGKWHSIVLAEHAH
jgi:hypothetical protein